MTSVLSSRGTRGKIFVLLVFRSFHSLILIRQALTTMDMIVRNIITVISERNSMHFQNFVINEGEVTNTLLHSNSFLVNQVKQEKKTIRN